VAYDPRCNRRDSKPIDVVRWAEKEVDAPGGDANAFRLAFLSDLRPRIDRARHAEKPGIGSRCSVGAVVAFSEGMASRARQTRRKLRGFLAGMADGHAGSTGPSQRPQEVYVDSRSERDGVGSWAPPRWRGNCAEGGEQRRGFCFRGPGSINPDMLTGERKDLRDDEAAHTRPWRGGKTV